MIVIHPESTPKVDDGCKPLRFALSSRQIADIVINGICSLSPFASNNGSVATLAVPNEWQCPTNEDMRCSMVRYDSKLPLIHVESSVEESDLIISDGRFVTRVAPELLAKAIQHFQADILAINIKPDLAAYREHFRFTTDSMVVGCRRIYSDTATPAIVQDSWPHHVIIKGSSLNTILADGQLPLSFPDLLKKCSSTNLKVIAADIGGFVLDLETEEGLIDFISTRLRFPSGSIPCEDLDKPDNARVVGKVIFGKNVRIGQNSVVIGPAVIGDNVTISKEAVIYASVIAPGVAVPAGVVVKKRLIMDSSFDPEPIKEQKIAFTNKSFREFIANNRSGKDSLFRSFFSYPVFLKRFFDIIASSCVLLLFAPFIPLIALALKLNSPGPLFYRARRQGLHGKEFDCLKFRTMIVGADKMQDDLRCVNQIDGPQFKMDDDPRISTVGRFLRDTCIDEIPQFINVFFGQMSLVGPRPSPESENTLCPSWRDLRLSVRPGITGLWQVYRTREPSRDFQEWILYDTRYVKQISFKKDLCICWLTFLELVRSFARQF